MRISPEKLLVRKYDDLRIGVSARDEYELVKVGAILRQLLLDQTPLIHKANRQYRIKMQFSVNDIFRNPLPVQPDVHFVAAGLDPSQLTVPAGTKALSLDKFLRLEILNTKTHKFSIREFIKYAANKAGGVHYDETFDPRERALIQTLDTLGGFNFPAVGHALRSISRIVLATLAPLRQAIVKLPSSLALAAHYKVPSDGSMYFAGQQFMETDNYTLDSASGFSWNAILRVIKQPRPGKRVIYELGCRPHDSKSLKFTIYLTDKCEIGSAARLNSKRTLNVVAAKSNAFPEFDRFVYLSSELCLENGTANLSLWINNINRGSVTSEYQGTLGKTNRQVIGGNLAGKQCSAFYIREPVVAHRCLTQKERDDLAEYFWLEWHD